MTAKKHGYALALIGLYLLDVIVLTATNPNKLPLVFLILPFVLLFTTVMATAYALIKKLPIKFVSSQRVFGLSALLAIFLVMLALFESIHQLSAKDVALSIAIVLAMGFYLTKAQFL